VIGQLRLVVAFLLIALAWAFPAFSENPPLAEPSRCVPLDLASSGTEVPYNLRAIDGTFLAGGGLFDPVAHSRQEDQVRTELRFLKEHGVKTVIMLEVPVSINLDRLTEERICREEGLRLLEIRMTSEEVPSASQTSAILSAVRPRSIRTLPLGSRPNRSGYCQIPQGGQTFFGLGRFPGDYLRRKPLGHPGWVQVQTV